MSKAEEVMVKRTRIKCLKMKNGLALEMMTRMTMDQRTGRLMTRRLMIPLKKALSMCLIQSWHSVGSYRFSPLDRYRYRSGSVLDRTELFNIGSVLQGSTNRCNRYRRTIRTDRC